MIVYAENSKESIKIVLELINVFSKVTGYNINIQISIVFMYSSNRYIGNEMKNIKLFTVSQKNVMLWY